MVVFVVSKRLHAKIQHFLQKGCIIMEKEELQKKHLPRLEQMLLFLL